MRYKVKITLNDRIKLSFQHSYPAIKREIFYLRSGHWIYHCEYGPAIEYCIISYYTKSANEVFYLRNRKMNKEHWEKVLPKLKYLK